MILLSNCNYQAWHTETTLGHYKDNIRIYLVSVCESKTILVVPKMMVKGDRLFQSTRFLDILILGSSTSSLRSGGTKSVPSFGSYLHQKCKFLGRLKPEDPKILFNS